MNQTVILLCHIPSRGRNKNQKVLCEGQSAITAVRMFRSNCQARQPSLSILPNGRHRVSCHMLSQEVSGLGLGWLCLSGIDLFFILPSFLLSQSDTGKDAVNCTYKNEDDCVTDSSTTKTPVESPFCMWWKSQVRTLRVLTLPQGRVRSLLDS